MQLIGKNKIAYKKIEQQYIQHWFVNIISILNQAIKVGLMGNLNKRCLTKFKYQLFIHG